MNVLITRKIDPAAVELLQQHFAVDYIDQNRPLARDYLVQNLSAYHAVLSTITERLDADLLRQARPNLQVISNMAAGLDNIDQDCAKQLGIRVFNIPEMTIESTADMTLAVALTLIRQVIPAQKYILNNEWKGWDPEIFLGRSLHSMVWGICGFGRIGQAVARRAHAFGSKIFYYDPDVDCEMLDGFIGVKRVSLQNLLEASDVLSLHVPLTAETQQLINAHRLSMMKNTAFFINMARGKVVNSDDLIQALRQQKIAGAALDVFDPEPITGMHEIHALNNVVLTPHIGTATVECRRDMAVHAAQNIVDYFTANHFIRDMHHE